MSFSKWIKGGVSPSPESPAVDVGDTCFSHSRWYSANNLRELIDSGSPHWLISCFVWDSSPQGWAYWNARYEEGVPLSEEDFNFLRALADHFESGGGRIYAG